MTKEGDLNDKKQKRQAAERRKKTQLYEYISTNQVGD